MCLTSVKCRSMDIAAATQRFHQGDRDPRPLTIHPDRAEVAALPILSGLGEELRSTLLDACGGLQFRAGTTIVPENGGTPGLAVIHRGLVDLAHIRGEHECGVLLLSTRDLLLPSTALFDEPALVSARALTTTKLVLFDVEAVNHVLARSDRLATNIMKAISGQWRMAVRNILDLNCRSAAQRLASFLLRLADLQDDSSSPVLPIAKRHLAARLGMTAETLSRMLQVVAQNGLHLRGRTIIIHDRARIDEFCGPDPYPCREDSGLNVFAL